MNVISSIDGEEKTNILYYIFYLLITTRKYGDSVLGTDVAG